jgi:hypothetical protein
LKIIPESMEGFSMGERLSKTGFLQIREFLTGHGCAPAPWESTENVIERLHAALRAKTDEDDFWEDLKEVVRKLEDERFDPNALRGSRVLNAASMDALIDELRSGLGRSNGGGMRKWLAGSVGTASLMAFLLLGTAAGTGEAQRAETANEMVYDQELEPGDEETFAYIDETGIGDFIVEGETENYYELVDVVLFAEVPVAAKQDLIACLPDLDGAYREALLHRFDTMADDELVGFLQELSNSEGVRGAAAESADDDLAMDTADGNDTGGDNIFVPTIEQCCGCGDDDDDDDDDH